MGIKQLVKRGELTIAEALNRVRQDCHTYGWPLRRSARLRAAKKS